MPQPRLSRRSALLTCGLLFALLAVPFVLTWRAWRQEQLNQALIVAIKANNTEAVIADLHVGADPNARERSQALPSFWESLRMLVMHRQNSALHGKTALEIALAFPDAGDNSTDEVPPSALNDCLIQALLEAGANPNLPTGDTEMPGISPLMWAAWQSSPSIVQILLDHCACVNGKGRYGMTPLMFASLRNDGAAVTLLLIKHGADVNMQDFGGVTALMRATVGNYEDTMRVLLAHHVNVNIKDDIGMTALKRAHDFPSSNAARLLKQAGATK